MLVSISRKFQNSVRNPRSEGSTPGTPGTAPTNWSVTNTSGLTTSIVGTGTENGVPYLDFGLSGISGAGGGIVAVVMEAPTFIAALLGQMWVSSFYCKLQAGTLTGFTNILNAMQENDSGGASLAFHSLAITPPGTTLDLDRSQIAFALNQPTVAFVRNQVRCTIPALTTITATLRIGAPQMELASSAGPMVMPPTGAPGISMRWN